MDRTALGLNRRPTAKKGLKMYFVVFHVFLLVLDVFTTNLTDLNSPDGYRTDRTQSGIGKTSNRSLIDFIFRKTNIWLDVLISISIHSQIDD